MAPFVGAAIYLLLIIPFGLAISLIALFFGPEYGASAFGYEVTFEPTPPGGWFINQLPLSAGELASGGLAHSTPEDERVPPLIAFRFLGNETFAS
jgi:hypothetical protein